MSNTDPITFRDLFRYALAAAIVTAMLALPGIIMAVLGIVTGGAK